MSFVIASCKYCGNLDFDILEFGIYCKQCHKELALHEVDFIVILEQSDDLHTKIPEELREN